MKKSSHKYPRLEPSITLFRQVYPFYKYTIPHQLVYDVRKISASIGYKLPKTVVLEYGNIIPLAGSWDAKYNPELALAITLLVMVDMRFKVSWRRTLKLIEEYGIDKRVFQYYLWEIARKVKRFRGYYSMITCILELAEMFDDDRLVEEALELAGKVREKAVVKCSTVALIIKYKHKLPMTKTEKSMFYRLRKKLKNRGLDIGALIS